MILEPKKKKSVTTFTFSLSICHEVVEKEMATHSNTLALKIPWTEELGVGYYPWGRKESGMPEPLHSLHFTVGPDAMILGFFNIYF